MKIQSILSFNELIDKGKIIKKKEFGSMYNGEFPASFYYKGILAYHINNTKYGIVSNNTISSIEEYDTILIGFKDDAIIVKNKKIKL